MDLIFSPSLVMSRQGRILWFLYMTFRWNGSFSWKNHIHVSRKKILLKMEFVIYVNLSSCANVIRFLILQSIALEGD